jgi:SAM-dependent methyltransferase
MTRPTAEWIEDFYNSVWDEKHVTSVAEIQDFKPNPLVEYATEFEVPRNEAIFEVGPGYGQLLKQFREKGYTKLFGIEHSPHRADLAGRFTGATVYHGAFEATDFAKTPNFPAHFSLVIAKSVMEHMYDPNTLFRSASRIQRAGDLLLVGVPNALHEPTLTTLFFLPHLHAFTDTSLRMLASRHGYESVDVRKWGKGLHLIARKGGASRKPLPRERSDHFETFFGKWTKELGLESGLTFKRAQWHWENAKDSGHTGIVPSTDRMLPRLIFSVTLNAMSFLPTSVSRAVLRILCGIPRLHLLASYSVVERPAAVPLTIVMRDLSMLYK